MKMAHRFIDGLPFLIAWWIFPWQTVKVITRWYLKLSETWKSAPLIGIALELSKSIPAWARIHHCFPFCSSRVCMATSVGENHGRWSTGINRVHRVHHWLLLWPEDLINRSNSAGLQRSFGYWSKPWHLVHPKIAGRWMFIPSKNW